MRTLSISLISVMAMACGGPIDELGTTSDEFRAAESSRFHPKEGGGGENDNTTSTENTSRFTPKEGGSVENDDTTSSGLDDDQLGLARIPRCPANFDCSTHESMICSRGDTVVHLECDRERCGGIAGLTCSSRQDDCAYPEGTCGHSDRMGTCEPRPEVCTRHYDPVIGCDGNMNTGLTLRTVQIRDGVASVRAGATLLFESEPDAEEAETRLKASALLDAILRADVPVSKISASQIGTKPPTVLMVDHEDSFVHTLAGYFRRAGAEVVTFRSGFPEQKLTELDPQMVLLSPGPGRPQDFGLTRTIELCLSARLPVFGVCLGLQGIVEYFGGELALLPKPMHGKPSEVLVRGGRLFEGMPRRFTAGRYHSLYAVEDALPGVLEVTASTETGIVMGIEHRELPISAVQFHPESLMSLKKEAGLSLVRNVLEQAKP